MEVIRYFPHKTNKSDLSHSLSKTFVSARLLISPCSSYVPVLIYNRHTLYSTTYSNSRSTLHPAVCWVFRTGPVQSIISLTRPSLFNSIPRSNLVKSTTKDQVSAPEPIFDLLGRVVLRQGRQSSEATVISLDIPIYSKAGRSWRLSIYTPSLSSFPAFLHHSGFCFRRQQSARGIRSCLLY